MTNINKLSPKVYLFLTVFSSLITMLIYRSTMFRCLSFNTYNESKAILWAIWSASIVITYFLTFKRRRNYFSIFTNTVFPFGIYATMTYDGSHPLLVFALEMIILVLLGLFGIANIVALKIPDDLEMLLKMLKRRFFHFLNGAKSITAICLSILLIYANALYAFDSPSLIPAVKPTISVEEDKAEYLQKNLPAISKIDKSIWENISFEDRLDTLQVMANVDGVQQGLSHEINVRADSLGWGTMGCYDFSTHTVTINTQVIADNDPTDAVTTLCHEVRHAYQHVVADAYLSLDKTYQQLSIFDDARSFYENQDDYKSIYNGDSFDEYENQTIEKDSRKYAEEKARFYFDIINKYLAEET